MWLASTPMFRVHLEEAANHEAGADQQHDGERDLGDDHRGREPAGPDRAAVAAAPSFRTSFTFVLDTCSAGARPKRMPVVRRDRRELAEHARIEGEHDPSGLPTFATAHRSSFTLKCARPRPNSPPIQASSTLSISS